MTKIDRAALTGYCIAWGQLVEVEYDLAKLRKASRDITKLRKKNPNVQMQASNGLVSLTSNRNVIMEPLLSVRKQALEIMHKFLTEFGMTPASRSRIEVDKAKKSDDPMEKFLDHGQRQN